jgi:hypothetical protein
MIFAPASTAESEGHVAKEAAALRRRGGGGRAAKKYAEAVR